MLKQTHKFFGSRRQHAAMRGMDIAAAMAAEAMQAGVEVWLEATVLGLYQDGVLLVQQRERVVTVQVARVVIATGAGEKTLAFPNNDLPGIYGAGAVQTMLHLYGVLPGRRVLMVGAGNIGLIVSYQLLQAGVEVIAVLEAMREVGGYLVHASKIRRAGVPLLTRHTVVGALGTRFLTGVVIGRLDDSGGIVPGSERVLEVDVMCLAVGLTPAAELLWQAGCRMAYIPELGGHVPVRDGRMQTTVPGIYVAGDVAGVEEASSAMVEGRMAGLAAAWDMGFQSPQYPHLWAEAETELAALRGGPVGARIRQGLAKLAAVRAREVAAGA